MLTKHKQRRAQTLREIDKQMIAFARVQQYKFTATNEQTQQQCYNNDPIRMACH